MGKRDQGRLVHEIREALLERGLQPTKITQSAVAAVGEHQPTTILQPGFTIQKHNDGKSARLSYRTTAAPPDVSEGRAARQTFGELMMRRLISHNAALEGAGFVCLEINSRIPIAPYSIWRRAHLKNLERSR